MAHIMTQFETYGTIVALILLGIIFIIKKVRGTKPYVDPEAERKLQERAAEYRRKQMENEELEAQMAYNSSDYMDDEEDYGFDESRD